MLLTSILMVLAHTAPAVVPAAANAPPQAAPGARYALLVGANHGSWGEGKLQYATSDAKQMADVLENFGGFPRGNIVTLQDPSAEQVRQAFSQIRTHLIREQIDGQTSSLLFVYYSGHADAVALHLGGSTLPWDELLELTKRSAARTRLLMIDACRSGFATKVKGTTVDQPFAIRTEAADMPQGFAVVTSASADEAAQESSSVGGSFFTHYFVSALRGAGDINADGRVSLSEAFQYSADQTAASTASTLPGVQHATYRYRLRGHTDLQLTSPGFNRSLVALRVGAPGEYYFHVETQEGKLALEANITGGNRTFWLPAGHYFVQRRTAAALYQGDVELEANRVATLHESNLQPVEYQEVSLKGGPADATAPRDPVVALSVWGGVGRSLLDDFSVPWQTALQLSVPVSVIILDARLGLEQGTAHNPSLTTTLTTGSLAVGGRYAFFKSDVFDASAGLRLGALYLQQSYSGTNSGPGRWQIAPMGEGVLRGDFLLPNHFFIALETDFRVVPVRLSSGESGTSQSVGLQPMGSIGLGVAF